MQGQTHGGKVAHSAKQTLRSLRRTMTPSLAKRKNHHRKEKIMPYGKGTYGSKVGRPPAKKNKVAPKKKPVKKAK